MTAQPAHDCLARHPFWTVQSVFDPDGGGSDFAYTIGLHEHGLPELHIWARPDRGEDPGDDWMLSMHDRTLVLNELSWMSLDGTLPVGTELTREYDDGEAVLNLRVDPPTDPRELEAFGVDLAASVCLVSWSLSRPSPGVAAPMSNEGLARAKRDFDQIVAVLDHDRYRPPSLSWRLPARPAFGHQQRFGPRTPVILARVAQLVEAGVTDLNLLLHAGISVSMHGSLTFPVSMARSAARRTGRRDSLDAAEKAAGELVDWFTGSGEGRARWRELLTSLFGTDCMRDPATLAEAERTTSNTLHEVVLGCLAVEVVADVIDEKWLMAGRGPWLAGLGRPVGELPGPEWAASGEVLEALTRLLAPLSAQELGCVATLHEFARSGRVEEWSDYSVTFSALQAWSLVGAAGCPWQPVLAELPAWQSLIRDSDIPTSNVMIAPVPLLQEWASCTTAAITHRGRLTATQVASFCEPFSEALPDLEELINTPVSASKAQT